MKSKLQRIIIEIITLTVAITVLLFALVLYNSNLEEIKIKVNNEAENLANGINAMGIDYIQEVLPFIENSRITIIEEDGTVVFDSEKNYELMENHSDREEVIEALADGEGESIRESDTTLTETYYKAVLTDDEQIFRIGEDVSTAFAMTIELIPGAIVILILAIILGIFVARGLTKKFVKPFDEIDLENPMNHIEYPELEPLLIRIDEYNKMINENETMRREFSANVSHELKTPLTSILGYAEIIKAGIASEEDVVEFSGKIHTEAQRVIHLIDDIIKISRLDEGGLELMKEEIDLYGLMRDVMNRLALQTKEKNLKVEIKGESIKYEGIRHILDEMLYNIYENSIKYNVDNGSINVWVGGRVGGARIIIKDTGIGIPKGEENRIFERFYRVDKSHSKETGGTGLGLSIVKHGASIHEIEIKVESQLGEGTTIQLDF